MERALIVTVDFGRRDTWSAEERSAELAELASSAGARVARSIVVRRHKPCPSHFIGRGKAEEIAAACAGGRIGLVIFNDDLTPTQQRNLEDVIGAKTIDRTQLILDIFARRAHSNEGKLQVELAQLTYILPRLTGRGVVMSRLGGGIGTRGPGEQKLEVDRRRIRGRISHLKDSLADLGDRRGMVRKKRSRFSALTVAIVGYTNVGKSTLLNSLTDSDVVVRDKLFATLDPTVRKFVMPNNQKALFVDTVGFIKDLPHHLVEAFKATLEEVSESDVILHVVDAGHPKALEQADAVYEVLGKIGARGKPIITALNKTDLPHGADASARLKGHFNDAIEISALKKKGFSALIQRVLFHMRDMTAVIRLEIPVSDVRTAGLIYENGFVRKREYEGDKLLIEAEVPARLKDMLERAGQIQ
jgi:GTP-binding protein HflX